MEQIKPSSMQKWNIFHILGCKSGTYSTFPHVKVEHFPPSCYQYFDIQCADYSERTKDLESMQKVEKIPPY